MFTRNDGLEIEVFDFTVQITFAIETGMVGKKLDDVISNRTVLDSIDAALKTGMSVNDQVADSLNGQPALTIFKPILNTPACAHCHGRSRKVIGGILVRESIANAEVAASSARNRSIVFGILGSFILVLTMYFLVMQERS